MLQTFPVLRVIRNSEGGVRWMEVCDWLRRTSEKGWKLLKQIACEGERFDVMGVRRCGKKCFFSVGHFFFCRIF